MEIKTVEVTLERFEELVLTEQRCKRLQSELDRYTKGKGLLERSMEWKNK